MKKFLPIILISFLLFSCADFDLNKSEIAEISDDSTTTATTQFISNTDIPLLEGLSQIDGGDLGFDSASGSITSATYKSEIKLEKAHDFYSKTLPQMGWKLIRNSSEKLIFTREKVVGTKTKGTEKAEIEFINQDGEDVVKFFISSVI